MNRIGVMAESFNMGVSKGLEMAAQVGAAAVQVYVGGRGAHPFFYLKVDANFLSF